MDISIETYRNRIGNFTTNGRFSYITEYKRKVSYKSSTSNIYKIRKLVICMVLLISIISKLEGISEGNIQELEPHLNYIGALATSTLPVSFFILGGQVPTTLSHVNHLGYYDVAGVQSTATLQGVQDGAVHLDQT